MIEQVKAIISKNLPLVTNLSNVSAVLNLMENLNWCGFYLTNNDTLYLGPFQGEVACTVIEKGHGVCGECLERKETIIVDDVLSYPNHIACSSKSRSEMVVPIIKNNECVAVIDLDSPIYNRFKEKEKLVVEEISKILSELF